MEIYFIIVIGLILIGVVVWSRTPKGRGAIGELKVRIVIGKTVEGKRYVINNYMIVDEGKSSQIDHLLINKNGVFVIETKNYSGRIYGNEKQHEWTQVLKYGKLKNKLYNPLKQNATHIYRIKKVLPENTQINSLVVFVQNNTDFIEAQNVLPLKNLSKTIKKETGSALSEEQMKNLYLILQENKANKAISTKAHIKEIDKMKNNIENNICPRCGGKLIEKQGKYGNFFGCENYPKCKFIKKL